MMSNQTLRDLILVGKLRKSGTFSFSQQIANWNVDNQIKKTFPKVYYSHMGIIFQKIILKFTENTIIIAVL